jgi:hypothetical protein
MKTVPGAYPSGALKKAPLKGTLCPYLQTLDLAGKACQGQTSSPIWPFVSSEEKSFEKMPHRDP